MTHSSGLVRKSPAAEARAYAFSPSPADIDARFSTDRRPGRTISKRGNKFMSDASLSSSPLINETQAAVLLGMKVATLRRWRWAGRGPRYLKIEGAVRYDQADLEAYLQASRRRSTSDVGASTELRQAA